jgi:hypothetical protein
VTLARKAHSPKAADLFALSEHQEQVLLFQWAAFYPELRWMFAVPNGGDRHPAVAAKLKAEGVKRGVLDVWLPIARQGFHGLVIEMKVKGNDLSKEQREWKTRLEANGYKVAVCYGFEAARHAIQDYMGWKTV